MPLTIHSLLTSADNGVETMEDLKNVEEEDINAFGLNFGEKKRVKGLISSLCKSSPGISESFTNPHLAQLSRILTLRGYLFHACLFVQ